MMRFRLPRPPNPQPWTAPQRGVLIGFILILAAYVAIRYSLNPMYISDPQPLEPARARELADRLDPNLATADELAALPMIGEKRARDIVAHRERYVSEHSGSVAFEKPEDLMSIRGIGTSILMQIRPYLIFPVDRATTRSEGQ